MQIERFCASKVSKVIGSTGFVLIIKLLRVVAVINLDPCLRLCCVSESLNLNELGLESL